MRILVGGSWAFYCQFNNFYLHIDELLFSFKKDNFTVKYTGRHIIPEYARIEPVSTIVMFSCYLSHSLDK